MSTHALTILIFTLIIGGTLGAAFWAGRRARTVNQFWAADGGVRPRHNSFAIAGDFMSASAFLGATGLIFLFGFDGILFTVLPLVAWIPILLFFAERLRNLGRFTLTDALAARFAGAGLRTALAIATLAISGFYLLAQLIAAGSLFSLLADVGFNTGVIVTVLITAVFVLVGGMVAATLVQFIKAVLLIAILALLAVLLLSQLNESWLGSSFEPSSLAPGTPQIDPAQPGNVLGSGWNTLSVSLALVFGVVGLPHVMMRFFTVRDARAARASAGGAIVLMGLGSAVIVFLGLAARTYLSDEVPAMAASSGNLVAPRLAEVLGGGSGSVGGSVMLALVGAIAFATIIAVTAGLMLNVSSTVVRDLAQRGRPARSERRELLAARAVAVAVAAVMAALAIQAGPGLNATVLVTLAFSIAASANFPTLTLTLFWRRCTPTGAVAATYCGLISSLIGVALGPDVWNDIFQAAGPAPISLGYPTIFSLPIGFAAGVLGSLLTQRRDDTAFDALQLKASGLAHLAQPVAEPAGSPTPTPTPIRE